MAREVVEIPPDAPRPRLCHIVKRDNFNGYGFNLHAQKARPGQFIGIVDAGSPAEDAGLREGDRIVEVNGTNIAQENHKQVVERIKAIPNETSLLVVDKATEDYYRKLDIIVSNDLPNISRQSSVKTSAVPDSAPPPIPESESESEPEEREPEPEPEVTKLEADVGTKFKIDDDEGLEDDEEDEVVDEDAVASGSKRRTSSRSSTSSGKKTLSLGSETGSSLRNTPSPQPRPMQPSVKAEPTPTTVPDGAASKYGDLNLNMTAAEMRERIGSKKKRDPRKDKTLDFRKKYEIIQTL